MKLFLRFVPLLLVLNGVAVSAKSTHWKCRDDGGHVLKLSSENIIPAETIGFDELGPNYALSSIVRGNLVFHNQVPFEKKITSISITYNVATQKKIDIEARFMLIDGSIYIFWFDKKEDRNFGLFGFNEKGLKKICQSG